MRKIQDVLGYSGRRCPTTSTKLYDERHSEQKKDLIKNITIGPDPVLQTLGEFERRVNKNLKFQGFLGFFRSFDLLGFYGNLRRRGHSINSYSPNVTFLYPLKTSENLGFSDVFRGYRNVTLGEYELNISIFCSPFRLCSQMISFTKRIIYYISAFEPIALLRFVHNLFSATISFLRSYKLYQDFT